MKEYTTKEITDFVCEFIACKETVSPATELEKGMGITGDDFDELIQKYSEKFNVDMTDYKWFFHTVEESCNISILFKSPDKYVENIPVTIKMLIEFANSGKWDVKYPEYEIPPARYDIYESYIIYALILASVLSLCFFIK